MGEDVLRYAVHDAVRSSEGPADLTWPPAPPYLKPPLWSRRHMTPTCVKNFIPQQTCFKIFHTPTNLFQNILYPNKLVSKYFIPQQNHANNFHCSRNTCGNLFIFHNIVFLNKKKFSLET